MLRHPLGALALFLVCAAHAADSRGAFLTLLERPRVPLAPTTQAPVENDGKVEIAFTYAADADNRVPGILIKPAGAATVQRPAVIVLHGTGGNKEGERALLVQLAHAGFVGIAIDGRHHGARAPGATKAAKSAVYTDAVLRAYRTGKEHPFFFDTAWDVMRLIDYLETRDDIDARRIGMIGFSKGGIETYLTAAADPRVAAAVSCIGMQSFRWAIDHDAWQSRMGTIQAAFDAAARDAGVAQPGAAFVRAFYDRVAPGIYGAFDGPAMAPLIAPRPLLLINGDTDARTPLPGLKECTDAASAAYRAAGAEEKFHVTIQPNTGHKVNPESLVQAHQWLARWLKP
jgi:dienelactone hydrolase